ncbi:hypothetical protein [Sphingomonas sp.]|uniref:hypothetical protein n=1 Tax=Sphingomonas sp. TaxID=28214 RepID=UPI003B3B49ED
MQPYPHSRGGVMPRQWGLAVQAAAVNRAPALYALTAMTARMGLRRAATALDAVIRDAA